MPPKGKWVKGASGSDCAIDVAERSLDIRLRAVEHYLPLAALQPGENVEHVHQLRVCTRRALAAFELYHDFLPPRRTEWLAGQLKKIRKAAGDARDYDVLGLRLSRDQADVGALRLLDRVRSLRRDAQPPILKVHDRLMKNGRLNRRIGTLLERVGRRSQNARKGSARFDDWALGHLAPVVDRFFAAGRADLSEIDKLHELRIRGKELRYAMELLAAAFPEPFTDELYPIIGKLQYHLGEVNDHATAIDRFRRWLKKERDAETVAYLHGLLAAEIDRLERSRQAFFAWWTLDRCADLEDRFNGILNQPAPVARPEPDAVVRC